MSELDELWAEIQKKKSEVETLREKYFALTQADEEKHLRETYLGKYYLKKDYNAKWHTYVYVNELDVKSNKLECIEFTIIYEDNDEIYGVRCETNHDFSCHYISTYCDEPDIDKCVEITREEFLEAYTLFLATFLKTFNR